MPARFGGGPDRGAEPVTLFDASPPRCQRCAGELNAGECPKCRHSYPAHLYDGSPPHVAGDTSTAAAKSVRHTSGAKRERVLATIARRPMTCDRVELITGWSHQTVSARIRELVQLGALRDTGLRATTRSGRKARVYATVTP